MLRNLQNNVSCLVYH